jgi:hypothetical protein
VAKTKEVVPSERIESRILVIRGHRAMLDVDLAEVYGTTTRRLNEQMRRNKDRFPADFMFRLTEQEKAEVVAKCDHLRKLKFSPNLPFAFTEHGAIMLASVLSSSAAVQASIAVVRAFVRLREVLATHKELALKVAELESRMEENDQEIVALFEAIRELMEPVEKPGKKIGFLKS